MLFSFFQHASIIALLSLVFVNATYAQKPNKDSKGRDKKIDGELNILKNISCLFVNDNSLPKYLKTIYKRDATRLALRLINEEQRLSKQTIRVPEEYVQQIYNVLVAVRLSELPVVDTMTTMYNVRTFPIPNLESIILVLNHNDAWLALHQNRQCSEIAPQYYIDSIIREYNLVMTRLVYLDEEHAGLILKSQEPLNIPALTMKFFIDEGITSIEEILPFEDGNDINIIRTPTGWELTYSVKFGECVQQCSKFYNWKFAMTEGGEVTYLGGAGHTIPPWVGPDADGKKYPDVLTRK